jgi:hypothetical protein
MGIVRFEMFFNKVDIISKKTIAHPLIWWYSIICCRKRATQKQQDEKNFLKKVVDIEMKNL